MVALGECPRCMKDPIARTSEMKTSATMATVPDFRMGPVWSETDEYETRH